MLSLIVNPASGGGRAGRLLPRVVAELDRRGVAHEVNTTTDLPHARELAVAAARAGHVPVAFGGDGLIGAVIGALRHSGIAVGVLPGGRGNDFARVLGIPLDPVAACAVLIDGAALTIDLGVIGERVFIGIATCGFDSIANRIANAARIVRGNLVYTYGGLRALATWTPATFEIVLDGETRSVHGYTVATANTGAYGGGMLLAPDADPSDGRFDVVLIAHCGRLRFLGALPRVFRGTHLALANVERSPDQRRPAVHDIRRR